MIMHRQRTMLQPQRYVSSSLSLQGIFAINATVLMLFTLGWSLNNFDSSETVYVYPEKSSRKTLRQSNAEHIHDTAIRNQRPNETKHKYEQNKKSELAVLAAKKAVDNQLFISIVDSGYVPMALNLWETSYVKFGITNYLFICTDAKAKSLLPDGVNDCFVATSDQDGDHPSRFGTSAFNKKVIAKTKVSLDLLLLGYSVIVVDLDVVFLKNPLPYLNCEECDLLIQNDGAAAVNTGFYLIHPTKNAIELQKEALDRSKRTYHKNDQDIMNELVSAYFSARHDESTALKVVLLDYHLFQPGNIFFSSRNFAHENDCSDCVIVHNNWILGIRDKIYRFKEMLLWLVDTDGYYSSTKERYITYSNPINSSREQERKALELAFQIGKLLNRTIILPQFNCPARVPPKRCHLLEAFGSSFLENRQTSAYRESVFLQHPKVPESTKLSISPEIDVKRFTKNTSYSIPVLVDIIFESIIANRALNDFKVIRFASLIF